MHDHSRFQHDIDDVTGISLSLSLYYYYYYDYYYYSQKSLTHNIGSASGSALPIISWEAPNLGADRNFEIFCDPFS